MSGGALHSWRERETDATFFTGLMVLCTHITKFTQMSQIPDPLEVLNSN